MSIQQIIGWAMIAAPFVGAFAIAARALGVIGAIGVFALTAGIVALTVAGTVLIGTPP